MDDASRELPVGRGENRRIEIVMPNEQTATAAQRPARRLDEPVLVLDALDDVLADHDVERAVRQRHYVRNVGFDERQTARLDCVRPILAYRVQGTRVAVERHHATKRAGTFQQGVEGPARPAAEVEDSIARPDAGQLAE